MYKKIFLGISAAILLGPSTPHAAIKSFHCPGLKLGSVLILQESGYAIEFYPSEWHSYGNYIRGEIKDGNTLYCFYAEQNFYLKAYLPGKNCDFKHIRSNTNSPTESKATEGTQNRKICQGGDCVAFCEAD